MRFCVFNNTDVSYTQVLFDTCGWNMNFDLWTTMQHHNEVIRICKQINISREIQTKQI